MSAIGYFQLIPYFDSFALHCLDFFGECDRIYDDACSDDICQIWSENTGRNRMKNKFFIVKDKGMSCIGASLKSANKIIIRGHTIDYFSFAFIPDRKSTRLNSSHVAI